MSNVMENENRKRFNGILYFVFLLVSIAVLVSVLLAGCSTAKASETADVYDEIEAYYFANMSTSNKQAIRNVVFDADRPLKYYFIAFNTAYLQNHNAIIIFSEYPEIMVNAVCSVPEGNYQGSLSGSYITWQIYNDNRNCRMADNNDYSSCKMAAIWVDGGSNPWGALFDYYRSGQSSTASVPYWIYKFTSRTAIGGLSLGSNRGVEAAVHGYKSNAVFFNNYGAVMNNTDPMPSDYVEDNRLKLSVLTDGTGARYLHANLTDFWFGTPGVVVNEFSDITVTIDVDGDNLVYPLTSENSIFRLSQEHGYFHIETSLRYFELDDYDRAVITGFSFAQSASAYGQSESFSYHILCDLVLKDNNPAPEIVDKEYEDDAYTEKITQIIYDAIRDQVNFQEGYYSPQGGGGAALDVPAGFNVKYIMLMGSTPLSTVLQRFLDGHYVFLLEYDQYLADLGASVVNEVAGITSTPDAKAYIESSLKNNEYSAFYDIVVYYWCPDSSLAELDCMYYYYTESGRLRQANQLLADIYQQANQTAFNTYVIYDYLYTRLNDFEQQSLDKMFEGNTLVRKSNDWLQSIYNKLDGLDDIVNAINDIQSFDDTNILHGISLVISAIEDIGVADTSGIEARLDKLIYHFLASDATQQRSENYLAYVSWLSQSDTDDASTTPVEWAASTFGLFTSIYDYFNVRYDPYDDDGTIDNYWEYAARFIEWNVDPEAISYSDPDLDAADRRTLRGIFGSIFGVGPEFSPNSPSGFLTD